MNKLEKLNNNILLFNIFSHLTFSEARKMPVQEFTYQKVIDGLGLNSDEFIDLCILLGCDYCESIREVGPKRAIELIQQHRSIEEIVRNIDLKKFTVPEDWNYEKARELFKQPEVTDPTTINVSKRSISTLNIKKHELIKPYFQLKWTEPDEEGLVKFLCGDRQFSEERVRNGAKKILKSKW